MLYFLLNKIHCNLLWRENVQVFTNVRSDLSCLYLLTTLAIFRSCIILQVENCNIFELLLQNLLSSHQQYIYTFIEVVCILGRFEQQGLLIAWGSVFYLLYNLNKENGVYSFVSSFCTWYCVDDSISTISSFLIIFLKNMS